MRRARGFTMVELIVVIVLMGVISAVAIPKLMSDNTTAASAFGNQVISALRYASKSAVAHRRLVCASTSSSAVTLAIATAATATACDSLLAGPTNDEYKSTDNDVTAGGALATTLYFQPDGTITSDGAGLTTVAGTILINAQGKVQRTIAIQGASGYVE